MDIQSESSNGLPGNATQEVKRKFFSGTVIRSNTNYLHGLAMLSDNMFKTILDTFL